MQLDSGSPKSTKFKTVLTVGGVREKLAKNYDKNKVVDYIFPIFLFGEQTFKEGKKAVHQHRDTLFPGSKIAVKSRSVKRNAENERGLPPPFPSRARPARVLSHFSPWNFRRLSGYELASLRGRRLKGKGKEV